MKIKTAGILCICAVVAVLAAAERAVVSNRFARLEFTNGRICIQDSAGTPMLTTGPLDFCWSPSKATPVSAEKTGDGELRVNYKVENDPTGKVTVTGTFRLDGNKVSCLYDITAPGVNTGGIMHKISPQRGVTTGKKVYKAGIWTRVPKGTSYEKRGEILKQYAGKEISIWYLVRGNALWKSYDNEHLRVLDLGKGRYRGEALFEFHPKEMAAHEVSAANRQEPVALRLFTGRDFNIFESGTPEISAEVSNTSDKELAGVNVRFIARNYDGKTVLDQQQTIALPVGKRQQWKFRLPAAKRNIYFVDASARVNGKEYFTRTNVALLPPHEYRAPRREIGISAHFDEPSREAVFNLMKRIGVQNLRNCDGREAEKYGMIAYLHNNVNGKVQYDPARDGEKLRKMLDQYREQQNIGWEFCNEWNFNQTAEQRKKSVAVYTSWLKAIRQEAAKRGQKINLISLGLAGADPNYLRELANAGAWNLIDGVALHPGRGNMSADCLGSGWFYLGGIRRTKAVLKELGGDKPLYLTEVYAKTSPNNWWSDSYRLAAENTLLSLALGIAEQVAAIQFYQLHDGVWADIGGVNEKDGEYSYGMLMRDNSPKPHLLAFAAASEALDSAEFRRYVELPGTQVRGLEFKTPRGKMAILYDRSEGYFFSKDRKGFVWPEPWVEHWKKFNARTFAGSRQEVTVVDAIGRERKYPVRNGKVKLTLSGAPMIVYGLDLP